MLAALGVWAKITKLQRSLCALLVFSFLLYPAPLHAKRVALVVGISNYDYSPKLTNPGRDAAGMAVALGAAGFDVVQALDPSMTALVQALEEFYAKADGATAAVFFFAGHGLQFDGVNYLVPRDAQLRSETRLKQETVALQDVMIAIEKRANMTLVFLDACRDNPLAEELQRSAKGASRSAAIARGLAPMAIRNPDTLLVFAAAPGKTASDGRGVNSPFTASLLQNMAEPDIEVELMLKRVTRDVVQATKGAQVPERLSRLTSEFVFNARPNTEPVAPSSVPKAGRLDSKQMNDQKSSRKPPANPAAGGGGQQATLGKPDTSGSTLARAHSGPSSGCIRLQSSLTAPVALSVGTVLCSEDGTDRATITRITENAVGYAIGSSMNNCQPGQQCAFSWAGSPRFRVVIEPNSGSAAAMTATLMSW